MNGQENQPTSPLLCANGCGFYGSHTTKNMCSKCFRESMRIEKQQDEQQIKHQQAEAVMRAVKGQPKLTEQAVVSPTISDSDVPMSIVTDALSGDTDCRNTTTMSSEDGRVPLASSSVEESHKQPEPDGRPVGVTTTSPTSETATSVVQNCEAEKPLQKNKDRCHQCNKRVGLLGFQCRCGYSFCGTHRHSDGHNCQFDYRAFGRQQLSKANQKVVAEKLNRI